MFGAFLKGAGGGCLGALFLVFVLGTQKVVIHGPMVYVFMLVLISIPIVSGLAACQQENNEREKQRRDAAARESGIKRAETERQALKQRVHDIDARNRDERRERFAQNGPTLRHCSTMHHQIEN
jgi:hypothetical protein